jgi:hypothetical protein
MPAPKGNLNAFKHGLYSRQIRNVEAGDASPAQLSSLEPEITLLRVMIQRTMALAQGIDNLRDATCALDALGSATTRLASLLRMQKLLAQHRTPLADDISVAIQHLNSELRRKNG